MKQDLADTNPQLQEHFSLMNAPIPGQSLTNDPENPYPWEKAPEFTVLQEAIDFLFVTLTEEAALEGLVESAMQGGTIMELTRLVLFKGFTDGKWNPDLFLLLVEPTAYMIMGILERAGVSDYIVMDDDDEDLFGASLPEETKENLNNKEAPETVEVPSPSLMARQ